MYQMMNFISDYFYLFFHSLGTELPIESHFCQSVYPGWFTAKNINAKYRISTSTTNLVFPWTSNLCKRVALLIWKVMRLNRMKLQMFESFPTHMVHKGLYQKVWYRGQWGLNIFRHNFKRSWLCLFKNYPT